VIEDLERGWGVSPRQKCKEEPWNSSRSPSPTKTLQKGRVLGGGRGIWAVRGGNLMPTALFFSPTMSRERRKGLKIVTGEGGRNLEDVF